MALGGAPGCGGGFLLEVCQQFVRWEASYKAKPFPKKFESWAGPKIYKMCQMAWGGPPARPKTYFKILGLGPNFGPCFFGWVGHSLLAHCGAGKVPWGACLMFAFQLQE